MENKHFTTRKLNTIKNHAYGERHVEEIMILSNALSNGHTVYQEMLVSITFGEMARISFFL